jgi:hypothetical protein
MRNALLLALISTSSFAQVTQKVIYRGTLLEQGKPAADGTYVMRFSLYPAEGEATALNSKQLEVTVRDAAFEAEVGALFAGAKGDLYLGLEIKRADDAEFDQLSRSAVSAAPFAIVAATALEANSVQWSNVKNAPKMLQGVPGQMGPQGEVGPIGPAGSSARVMVEEPGLHCATGGFAIESADGLSYLCNGAVGAAGPQGLAGIQGDVGPQGLIGLQGEMGPQGSPGAKGDVGPMGATGAMGLMGPKGIQGATGEIGAMGATGAIGPMGPKGIQGATGDVGPMGATGAIGPMGPKGIQGATGDVGPMGATGALGAIGPQGIQGAKGDVGAMGATGAMGPQGLLGAKGDVGPMGATGAIGAVGAVGATGAMGSQGIQGAKGDVGPMGPMGATGGTGAKGDVGAVGAQGATGAMGPQGIQGFKGDLGDIGPKGLQGAVGAAGAQGAKGDTGDIGPMGPTGAQGATGAAGPQGNVGPAGTSVTGSSEGPGLNCLNGGSRYDSASGATYVCNGATGNTGATGATGAKGDKGDGVQDPLRDANGARIGLLVSFGVEVLTVITSNGHRVDLNVDGTVQRPRYVNYVGANCTGAPVLDRNFDDNGMGSTEHQRLYGKLVMRTPQGVLMRPKPSKLDATGSLPISTTVLVTSQGSWSSYDGSLYCYNGNPWNTQGFEFEETTAAVVGLPAAIVAPLQYPN